MLKLKTIYISDTSKDLCEIKDYDKKVLNQLNKEIEKQFENDRYIYLEPILKHLDAISIENKADRKYHLELLKLIDTALRGIQKDNYHQLLCTFFNACIMEEYWNKITIYMLQEARKILYNCHRKNVIPNIKQEVIRKYKKKLDNLGFELLPFVI